MGQPHERTQEAYVHAVRQVASHFGRPPDQLTGSVLDPTAGVDDDFLRQGSADHLGSAD